MPHVGRIPSTLEKYRHALSAYLEDITQLNFKSSNSFLYFYDESKTNTNTQYLSDESTFNLYKKHHNLDSNQSEKGQSMTPIPDTETRINLSYNTVKKQLDLLSSYFSLIHDDLHGDLLLLRTNLNLLPSNTLHIAQRNKSNNNLNTNNNGNNTNSSLHTINNDPIHPSLSEREEDEEDIDDDMEESKTTNYDTSSSQTSIMTIQSRRSRVSNSISPPRSTSVTQSTVSVSSASDVDEFNLDNILNTKQTQSIQYIVSILQKFIKYNAILVEHIHQNKGKIDSFWVQNNISNHPQIHKLNLGMFLIS